MNRLLRVALLLGVLIAIPVYAQDAEEELVYNPTVCYDAAEGEPLSDECLSMIEAFPEPSYENVPYDYYTLETYSFWRIGPNATPLYDSPHGNVVGEYPAGFNFVNAIDSSVEGWIQIQGGSWVPTEGATYTRPSYLRGFLLDDGNPYYPFAWVLDMTGIYTSETPGGAPSADTNRIPLRYEMVNIFAQAVADDGITWYMIGPNQWIRQQFVAVARAAERPEGVSGRWVSIDLFEQTVVAYEDDTPVFAALTSTGLSGTPTNTGVFEVWASLALDGMSGATGAPNAYALQTVPWVMYFDEGISLHGSYWHDLYGYPQSRGCVNLSVSDAKWLFQFLAGAEPNEDGEVVNYVYVYQEGSISEIESGTEIGIGSST